MFRTIALATIVALLTAAAITIADRLSKPAAAGQPLDPAIVATHLRALDPDLALP